MFPDEPDEVASRLAKRLAQAEGGMNQRDDRIAPPQWDQHVTDRKAPAPDRVDHGMVRVCGGIDQTYGRVGAELPGQIQRQLHARRKFRETLVDAELEVEGAVLMTQYDRGCHRRTPGVQRHDLALARRCEAFGGATDKGRIAGVLPERRAALALPAAGFQFQEGLDRRCDIPGLARDVEPDGAVLGEAVAPAAPLLQFLAAACFPKPFLGGTTR